MLEIKSHQLFFTKYIVFSLYIINIFQQFISVYLVVIFFPIPICFGKSGMHEDFLGRKVTKCHKLRAFNISNTLTRNRFISGGKIFIMVHFTAQ